VKYVRSLVVLIVAVAGGLIVALAVTMAIRLVTGDHQLSARIGAGCGLLCCLSILAYGSLWEAAVGSRRPPAGWVPVCRTKAESKLRTADLRGAFVFGIVGYAVLFDTTLPGFIVAIAVTCCAIAGGMVGYDVKRRARRIQEGPRRETPREKSTWPT
jgi:hypothetical protein